MSAQVARVIDISVELGEGPHWDVDSQCLYFVDIFGKSIHKYDPETQKHTKASIETNHVSFIIPIEGHRDKFLTGIGRDLSIVTWNGESEQVSKVEKIYEADNTPETLNNRFNDAKCDAVGRLWAGTMGAQPVNGQVEPHKGCLLSMGPHKRDVKIHLTKIGISNGLTWSTDNKYFYYIDSHKETVDQYDFDMKYAKLCENLRQSKAKIPGVMDGMTIDTDGNLWIAIFGGDRIIKIDPRKPNTLLESIPIPAHQVTSLAFGGENLDELYVTTAMLTTDGVEYPPPDNGAVYVITGTGATGLPAHNVKM